MSDQSYGKRQWQKRRDDINTSREIPKSPEAEQHLLGALLLDASLLSRISEDIGHLSKDDFFVERNRFVYEAIMHRAAVSDDFDTTVICSDLENSGLIDKVGGKSYVASLTDNVGPISAITEYARIIRDTSRRRQLISVAEHIESIGYAPEGRKVDELYDEAQGLVFTLSEKNAHTDNGPRTMTDVALALINKIKSDMALGSRMRGIATGFSGLDNLTSGLQGGSLNIIAARPGIGKTSFAMNIVENIAMNPDNHKPALVFSLEMPSEQIALRMLSTFGRVPMKELSLGNVTPAQWHDIVRKVVLLADDDGSGNRKNKLYIDDSGDLTPLELRSRARKIAADNGGLSVIMIDYIQLMKGQTKAENRSLEVGEISRSLKLLAKELNVPVIALSQLNREVEGRKDHRPMNSDLRESGSLEQDADLILFLHRESVYKDRNASDVDESEAKLIVSKNRNGATGDIDLQFQGAYTAFYDKADPNATYDQ
jgi:replicative DNA helicase